MRYAYNAVSVLAKAIRGRKNTERSGEKEHPVSHFTFSPLFPFFISTLSFIVCLFFSLLRA